MTMNSLLKENKKSTNRVKIFLCILAFALSIYFSGPLKDGVINGLNLCFFNIIPTLFPFFILSDLWSSVINLPADSIIGRCFKRIFNVSGEGVVAFVIGSLCGFPLGASTAAKRFNDGLITKEELESLSVICNNPSAAFVISGVGAGLLGSIKTGFFLYFSTLISAIIIGAIFKTQVSDFNKINDKPRQSFDLIDSIKNASTSSITVSSYIIFFSALIGLCRGFINNDLILSLVSSFLEIGTACNIIAKSRNCLGIFYLPLISFALSFSGLSVFLQSFSILPPCVSKKSYLIKKLCQGIISGILTFFFIFIKI